MINIPSFERVDIDNFGLYPGPDGGPAGLHATLPPGLTLVVGANGLGKTTLVTLLYRLVAGPFDIPSLSAGEELGTRRLEATQLSPSSRGVFASRVADRATEAEATLAMRVGTASIVVKRQLSTLALTGLWVDGEPAEEALEISYQSIMNEFAGVGSFGDLLLMLRYLVFYFEDRRALVWDQSAQRQLLRMLFLPPDQAQEWTRLERSILSKDSDVRNFTAVVGRVERELTRNLTKAHDATALRSELVGLEALQENDRERMTELGPQLPELDAERHRARTAHLMAQQDRESRYRAVEEAKLLAIQAHFPEMAATGRYILAHLMSEEQCLVCGSHSPDAAHMYADRIAREVCVVCETPLGSDGGVVEERTVAAARVAKRDQALADAERLLAGASADRTEAEARYDEHRRTLTKLDAAISERAARIEEIVSVLPPSEQAMRKQRDELGILRARLEERKSALADERSAFGRFVSERTEELLGQSDDIVRFFGEYASGFLSESISLTWSSNRTRLGQTGDLIEFPSFDLDMSGSDFGTAVRRSGPSAVSESQREFIDLAFRMALMRAATTDGSGTLVIDTPESSLDIVFAERAGKILLRFAGGTGNRLLVTSNLVEGSLIPTLVQGIAALPDSRARLIDLFAIAKPTAAVAADATQYEAAKQRLLTPLYP